jgi:DNA polymerase III epsilon subunit-like protein
MKPEFYIVVDIETSGPTPCLHAILSLGAATVSTPRESFYIEFKPDKIEVNEESMGIHGLSFKELSVNGTEAQTGLESFARWIEKVTLPGSTPVFCAFNAPFDWMFVNDYFHRYLGYNPFGHKALDIKALYMGHHGTTWGETSHAAISTAYGEPDPLSHHAHEDALQEAKLLEKILEDISKGK